MSKYFAISLFCCLAFLSRAQGPALPDNQRWKGFERVYHRIGAHIAYTVKPDHPLPGNPWIWRASFPDWHTEMDSLLLAKGFWLGYVSVDDQYGSPYAMQVWDRFYQYVTDSLSFAPRVALEAVSRGGLYAYGWAKRNPDKITCIYGEAPVCDVKSWPGGKGLGKGAPDSWQQLLGVYKMTEKQVMDFSDNPIDHLEGLASFKVPIIHLIGAHDEIVPNEENTYLLAQRYERLGGPVLIYPVTVGPQELGGHHFPIEHADWWADIVLKNSYPVRPVLPYDPYISVRGGLENAFRVFTARKKATVAFLGGSITYNPGWRDKVCNWLKERYPETEFRFIAAGIPSLGSLPHAFRLQRDVLDSGKVDLLFVEAAVNDRGNGTDSLTQIRSLEGIVQHAKRSNPSMDIVLMSFADPEKTRDYNQGIIPVEIANHEKIAEYYRLPSINLALEVRDKIGKGEFSWEYDFKDLHPSPFGQELYFATIRRLLEVCAKDSAGTLPGRAVTEAPLNLQSFTGGIYYPIGNAHFDSGWSLDKDWTPSDGLETREGFVHRPMLVASTPGSTLTLPFEGSAIGIAIVSGAGAGMVSWSIDKGPFIKKDLFTQWSAYLHLPWYVLFSGSLKNRKHVLTLRIDEDKNKDSKGHACRILYFLVNQKDRS
ncbi:MAG: SGNH/GDSL hydrolase family protein [Puia sp.]|nr:SGNH/GDSL hydrolase family protein [Puia sp.]